MDKMAQENADAAYTPNYGMVGTILVIGIGLFGAASVLRRKRSTTVASSPGKGAKVDPKKSAKASPAPSLYSQKQPVEPAPTVERLPANQAEVDALEFEERGTSFFTARPVPGGILIYTPIQVGNYLHKVMATDQEYNQVENGQIPMVRAFTVGDKTAPWYEWEDFNPYDHYWEAMDGDWRVDGVRAIACWLPLDQCNPRLKGYYMNAEGGGQLVDVDASPDMASIIDDIDDVQQSVHF